MPKRGVNNGMDRTDQPKGSIHGELLLCEILEAHLQGNQDGAGFRQLRGRG